MTNMMFKALDFFEREFLIRIADRFAAAASHDDIRHSAYSADSQ